ncbi:fibrinogen-like protein 1 [Arapaima gigas]
MGKTEGWKGVILGFMFFTHICVSSSDECQQENVRLRAQVRTLQERVATQQALLSQLHSQHTQVSTTDGIHIDTGGEVEYADCTQVYNDGKRQSGLYVIKPLRSPSKITVYCDMTEGGGWTVFQRRTDGKESFYRRWAEYKKGFGNMRSPGGEFWLGNDNLHYLTSQGDYTLRINMEDFEGNRRFAVYKSFKVADEKVYPPTPAAVVWPLFRVEFRTALDAKFNSSRCADFYEIYNWLFFMPLLFLSSRCHSANLNGFYYRGPYTAVTDNGIVWYTWHGWWYSLKSVEMKVRSAHFEPNQV